MMKIFIEWGKCTNCNTGFAMGDGILFDENQKPISFCCPNCQSLLIFTTGYTIENIGDLPFGGPGEKQPEEILIDKLEGLKKKG